MTDVQHALEINMLYSFFVKFLALQSQINCKLFFSKSAKHLVWSHEELLSSLQIVFWFVKYHGDDRA